VIGALPPVILGIMVVEVAVLAWQPAARRRRFLPTVCAGMFIVAAWTASASGWPELVVLAALAAALVAHATDITTRWHKE
jgi:hypothetical protein